MIGGTKSINIFIAKIFGFYAFWLLSEFYLSHEFDFYQRVWIYIYHIFLKIIHTGSVFVLDNIMNLDVVHTYNAVAIVGSYGVIIGNNCVGFGLSYAFAALIASYPGPWKLKLAFIPLGIAFIALINIIRIVFLTKTALTAGIFERIENHELFNNIIYVIIFLLWMVWVRIIERKNKAIKNQDPPAAIG